MKANGRYSTVRGMLEEACFRIAWSASWWCGEIVNRLTFNWWPTESRLANWIGERRIMRRILREIGLMVKRQKVTRKRLRRRLDGECSSDTGG